MTSLRYWQTCHYCGVSAGGGVRMTSDHIVPRCDLPKPLAKLPYWFRSQLEVPACFECNGTKSALRSDCVCPQCNWVWSTAVACFLPEGYQPRGYIAVVKNREPHEFVA